MERSFQQYMDSVRGWKDGTDDAIDRLRERCAQEAWQPSPWHWTGPRSMNQEERKGEKK